MVSNTNLIFGGAVTVGIILMVSDLILYNRWRRLKKRIKELYKRLFSEECNL